MATREINLIGIKKKFTPYEEKIKGISHRLIPIVLITYAIILISVFSVSFYIQDKLASKERSVASERDQIKKMSRDEGKYLLLKQKADALQQILGARFPYVDLFEFFHGLASDMVKISSLEMNQAGSLVINVNTLDSAALDTFISAILDQAQKRFGRVELTGVDYKSDNTYSITLNIQTILKNTQ